MAIEEISSNETMCNVGEVTSTGAARFAGTVVVTGAGGFIGRAWCAHARSAGRPLRALMRARSSEAPAQAYTIALDLETATRSDLADALAGACAVVHLAGRAHRMERTPHAAIPRRGGSADHIALVGEAMESAMRGQNVEVTARLARAAVEAGVARFVFASTIKVHGEATAPGRPFRPDDPSAPQDAYARSKLAAESALVAAAAGTQMLAVILRLPMVYGAGAKGNFARLTEAVATGRWLPLAGVRNRRSLLSLGNLLAAIDAAIDASNVASSVAYTGPAAPPQCHLLADADGVSTPQLVRAIATALDVPAHLYSLPVSLLRLAGAATNRSAEIARLTDSLEADATSFTAWTGWHPRPFAIERSMFCGRFGPEGRGGG